MVFDVVIREFESEELIMDHEWEELELWQFGNNKEWKWMSKNASLQYLKFILV